mgnify:CR=1 FL=1
MTEVLLLVGVRMMEVLAEAFADQALQAAAGRPVELAPIAWMSGRSVAPLGSVARSVTSCESMPP